MTDHRFDDRKEITAGQLMKELENDPEFLKQRAERTARRNRRLQAMFDDERPILERLKDAGFEVESLEEIAPKFAPLPDVLVESLLDCLPLCGHDRNRELVIRALGAAKNRFDGRPLIASYKSTYDEGVRFAVLNTIALTKPHSIDTWLEAARRDPYLHAELEKLGYDFEQ
jgi:hypothetical protein